MHKELKKFYGDLLECHISNLYGLFELLKNDKLSIEKTFDLLIYYSQSLKLKENTTVLFESKKTIYTLFDRFQLMS